MPSCEKTDFVRKDSRGGRYRKERLRVSFTSTAVRYYPTARVYARVTIGPAIASRNYISSAVTRGRYEAIDRHYSILTKMDFGARNEIFLYRPP